MSNIDIKNDQQLIDLLFNADKSDLDLLIDYITDNGNGRFSLSSSVKTLLVSAKELNEIDEDTLRILIRELQLYGGNSFVNLFRGNGVDYAEIVDDVLERLKISAQKSASLARKENLIISKVFEDAWEKMSAAQRKEILDSLGMKSSGGLEALKLKSENWLLIFDDNTNSGETVDNIRLLAVDSGVYGRINTFTCRANPDIRNYKSTLTTEQRIDIVGVAGLKARKAKVKAVDERYKEIIGTIVGYRLSKIIKPSVPPAAPKQQTSEC